MAILAPLVLLLGIDDTAGARVRTSAGGQSIQARAAPFAMVLQEVARQTGMQVLYDGAPPRQSVTVSIRANNAAQALLRLLDRLSLNYALTTDAAGLQVKVLLLVTDGSELSPIRRLAPPVRPLMKPPTDFEPLGAEPATETAAAPEPVEDANPADFALAIAEVEQLRLARADDGAAEAANEPLESTHTPSEGGSTKESAQNPR